MAARHPEVPGDEPPRRRRQPAKTPQARENELIALAQDEIEAQIREGRASSQVLTFYAKAGSTRDKLEKERLQAEVEKLQKQIEDMNTAVEIKDLLEEGLQAFRGYQGIEDDDEDEFY